MTPKEITTAKKYARKRSPNLTFGPLFKEERTIIDVTIIKKSNIKVPKVIQDVLKSSDFEVIDYKEGTVKKKDNHNIFRLGKVIQKVEADKELKDKALKCFNERLAGLEKNDQDDYKIVITHNPVDVAGMSTDKHWTSCMNLRESTYCEDPYREVQYGGMVAYLIKSKDLAKGDIDKAKARIAIKRFILQKNKFKNKRKEYPDFNDYMKWTHNNMPFVLVPEQKIYGCTTLATKTNFYNTVKKILDKNNITTGKTESIYDIKFTKYDGFSDTFRRDYLYFGNINNEEDAKKLIKHYAGQEVLDYLPRYIPEEYFFLTFVNYKDTGYFVQTSIEKRIKLISKSIIIKFIKHEDVNIRMVLAKLLDKKYFKYFKGEKDKDILAILKDRKN